jgi:hypothetical protein
MTFPKITEKEKFSKYIIEIVEKDDISYMDAIEEYCEMIGLEIEVAAKLITPYIISKISDEARQKNLINKSPVLPI